MRKFTCFAILIIGICVSVYGQDSTDLNKVSELPASYYDNLTKKFDGLEGQVTSKTKKYLKKIEREENKMYKKLWKTDSTKAKELFGNVSDRYNSLESKATSKANALDKSFRVYSGKLDSMETAIHFLEKNGIVKPGINSAMNSTIGGIKNLKDKLNQTEQIRKYLEERKRILTEELTKTGLLKNLGKFNKQFYYYKQQLQEYKKILEDPSVASEKLIGVLSKVPAFRNFFNKHSIFASLFRMPSADGQGNLDLTGLQTRDVVNQELRQRFGSDQQIQQVLQKNMQEAKDQLNKVRNIKEGTTETYKKNGKKKDFVPNSQKTKSFWKRLEPGANFQSKKSNGFMPVTSDIGLSLGYKLNDKSTIGIGASYKMGWGSNIRNINISHQGIGLRSFLDWKLKGSFYATGGYELNYFSEINRISQLKDINAWQQSGLLGITKIVSLNSKVFKKTKLQILYNFLYNQKTSPTKPIVFRVGYNF
jgi:hypothetical protein